MVFSPCNCVALEFFSVGTEVVGGANERQSVSSGSCVAIDAWCQHRYLVNVPGNTMALALKYRLLCGSVVITSPFIYHEWYYSQLKDGEHYVAVDLSWSSSEDLLSQLRTHPAVAQEIGMRAREWAKDYLTEDGFDSRWWFQIYFIFIPKKRTDPIN